MIPLGLVMITPYAPWGPSADQGLITPTMGPATGGDSLRVATNRRNGRRRNMRLASPNL